MAELKNLIASRGYVKGNITRLSVQRFSDDTYQALITKKERLVKAFSDYEAFNMSILALDPQDKEEYGDVEDKYYTTLASINAEIDRSRATQADVSVKAETQPTNSKMRLPAIQIPPFTGKYSEYTPFVNLFKSVINKDSNLDNVAKLYYLRTFLKNEPLDLVKNLPLTSDSYIEALRLLDERYNNRYRIVSDHIYSLLDINVLSKSTPQNIRDFVSKIKQALAALKNLGTKVNAWDDIVLCILLRKLDSYTARAYQLDRNAERAPSVQQFLEFLENRALALESSEPAAPAKKAVVNVASTLSEPVAA